jgi:CPA1 family monovalent cation:H+ antiporter
MQQAEVFIVLLTLVAALVVFSQKLALPYPIVLVLAGLALSFIPNLPEVRLNPELVLYFVLPALLYPAALFTSWRDFRRSLRPILSLAIGLVLVTTVTIGCVAHALIPDLPWAAALAPSFRHRMPSRPPRSSAACLFHTASRQFSRAKAW